MNATTLFTNRIAGIIVVLLCGAANLQAQDAAKKPGAVNKKPGVSMRIRLTSVMVGDQDKAIRFYTQILGFVKKADVPVGKNRWLTVVSPDDPDGPELLLELLGFAPAKTYQKVLFDAGIPSTQFAVADVQAAYEKMKKLGLVFRTPPTRMRPVTIAVFEDTCGNLIQLAQRN